jgi:hypothetical protein
LGFAAERSPNVPCQVRVGVYIDGFNLYYGGRTLCGASTPGWRWLDVRALARSRLPNAWTGATIERVVYCTARVSGIDDPSSPLDQDRYLVARVRRSSSRSQAPRASQRS